MNLLPDSVILHHICPFLDFFYETDIITLREVSSRFKNLIKKYFTLTTPKTYDLAYLNTKLETAMLLKYEFSTAVDVFLTNIDKVAHGELVDILSQNNQNKIDENILNSLKIVMKFVDYHKIPTINAKSRTEKRKKKIYFYLEFVSDY